MKRSNVFNLTLTAVFLAMNIALSSFGVPVPDFTGCYRSCIWYASMLEICNAYIV